MKTQSFLLAFSLAVVALMLFSRPAVACWFWEACFEERGYQNVRPEGGAVLYGSTTARGGAATAANPNLPWQAKPKTAPATTPPAPRPAATQADAAATPEPRPVAAPTPEPPPTAPATNAAPAPSSTLPPVPGLRPAQILSQ